MAKLGGAVVGDEYVLLGGSDFDAVVARIAETQPDVILNCINGDSNFSFFEALRMSEAISEELRTVSFSIAEDELRSVGTTRMAGDYCAWNYFQSVDSPENHAFVQRFKDTYGRNRVTDDPMEAAYFGVHLWARAVQAVGSVDPAAVRPALGGQTFAAPGGPVSIDPVTQHTCKTVRIGRIRADGQFDVLWTSPQPVSPEPYPSLRPRGEWDAFLSELYNGWGQQWANPGQPVRNQPEVGP